MRIAVLSDIHGNLPALEAVVTDAGARGCTGFANLGDILSGPLWPFETAQYLMARDWPTIAGNHERQVLTDPDAGLSPSDRMVRERCTADQLGWLAALPPTMTVGAAWCTHARPGNDHEYLLETVEGSRRDRTTRPATDAEIAERLGDTRARIVLHGHSHLPRHVTLPDGRVIANPGSVGLPAFFDDGGEGWAPHAHETGSPDARYLVLDGEAIELVAVAYDHEAAATRAEALGSPQWARWLREGLAR